MSNATNEEQAALDALAAEVYGADVEAGDMPDEDPDEDIGEVPQEEGQATPDAAEGDAPTTGTPCDSAQTGSATARSDTGPAEDTPPTTSDAPRGCNCAEGGKPCGPAELTLTPEWLAEIAELSARSDTAYRAVEEATGEVAEAKAILKAAEARYAAVVVELRETIRDGRQGQPLLPFGAGGLPAVEEAQAPAEPVLFPEAQAPEHVQLTKGLTTVMQRADGGPSLTLHRDPEAWRGQLLSELDGMPARVLDALRDHVPQIMTVGDLADFTAGKKGDRENRLTDVRGIGKAMVDKVDNALAAFWAEWNEQGETVETIGAGS